MSDPRASKLGREDSLGLRQNGSAAAEILGCYAHAARPDLRSEPVRIVGAPFPFVRVESECDDSPERVSARMEPRSDRSMVTFCRPKVLAAVIPWVLQGLPRMDEASCT
jgi:hypothetical protein